MAASSLAHSGDPASKLPWTSDAPYRILVEVAPVTLDGREWDEGPAEVGIDFTAALAALGVESRPALDTLQVMKLGADSAPLPYTDYAYAKGPNDRPFRWYDDAIPYDFSEVFAPTSYTDGTRRRMIIPRGGYMYSTLGDWKSGRLAWVHTQEGEGPSRYAVYFHVLSPGEEPTGPPPRAWVGDAMPRHDLRGANTTGADHTHISVDDWDGDGIDDLVYGEQYGQVCVLPNRGTPEAPAYPYAKLLFDAEGLPLDMGVHAAVLVVDWDNDGAKDLLAGTYMNRVAFYRNTGTDADRVLAYRGLLKDAMGNFLALPVTPVARKSADVFDEDYYPIMSAVDWNGDGRRDLIAGGYITGRIYYFENTGTDAENLPLLELRGPVEADGAPINVCDWCAAPDVADLNGDGLPDMVSGAYTWGDSDCERPAFLRYYENTGTREAPAFTEKPLPIQGDLIRLRVPSPRATDWNHDGLTDLIVSSGLDILLWKNVGTKSAPVFDITAEALPSVWGNATLPVGHQVLDWNGDGLIDLVDGYTVWLNSGAGNPYRFSERVRVLPEGVHIAHPTGIGDGHFWPYLHDLDRDGKLDVLFGDWHGNIWFHRNQSTGTDTVFDGAGYRLTTGDGNAIKVGPVKGDIEKDFVALQGARTKFCAGDFDGDGLDDLAIGDTYGIIRYYKNLGPLDSPVFAAPLEVADLKVRLNVDKVDWDGDGRLDIVAGVDNHRIFVFVNTGTDGAAAFDAGTQLDLPAIKGPETMAADMNGDGDVDLLIQGTQGTTLVERSFLRNGYARGAVVGVERKPSE